MRIYKEQNAADAYDLLLNDLYNNPEYITAPRGEKIKEVINVSIEIDNPLLNLYFNEERSSPTKYICAELVWYFSGQKSVDWISKYAKMWNYLQDDNGNVNSAYGNLIFTEKNEYGYSQYQWALDSLKKDKDTRQAFLHFNKEKHQYNGNKDQVCTMYGIFHIRNNKLNFTVSMRSNDVIYGLMTDFAFFSVLQQQMHRHLLKYYPELELGTYTHISNSMHLYEKHFQLVEKMLTKQFVPISLPELDCDLIDETGKCYNFMEIKESKFIKYIKTNI